MDTQDQGAPVTSGDIEVPLGEIHKIRPQHASLAMSIVSVWASIDESLVNILARIIKTDIGPAFELWMGINNPSTRWDVLLKCAHSVYPEDTAERKWLDLIADQIGWGRQLRNRLVHHIWATVKGRAELVLLLDPKRTMLNTVKGFELVNSGALDDPTVTTDQLLADWSTPTEGLPLTIPMLESILRRSLNLDLLLKDLDHSLHPEDSRQRQESRRRLNEILKSQAEARRQKKRTRQAGKNESSGQDAGR